MKLSVITVTYKDPEGLAKTLASLRKVPKQIAWESIVVDSSPQLNESILKKESFPIQHIPSAPEGIYSAMNLGISKAKGDYFWFLNGGDELVDEVTFHKFISLCTDKKTIYISNVELAEENKSGKIHRSEVPFGLLGVNSICHQGVIYPRESFSVGFQTNFKIVADYVHLLEMEKSGFRLVHLDGVFARFQKGGSSDSILPALKEFWKVHLSNPMHLSGVKRIPHFIFLLLKSANIMIRRFLKTIARSLRQS